MPRNASGTYSLASAAFVTNTVIASGPMNSNMNDIALALTQSIATTGVTSMTGKLNLFVGSVSAPGVAVVNDLGTGFYSDSANTWGWSANGTEIWTAASAGIKVKQGSFIDGTCSIVGSFPVGLMLDYAGVSAPNGWLLCFGQNISQSTYSALFAIIGTTYGNPCGGNFTLPDLRGRVNAALDSLGGTPANRLTNNASSGVDGSALNNSGGAQNYTMTQATLPNYTLPDALTITLSAADNPVPNAVSGAFAGAGGTEAIQVNAFSAVTGAFTGSVTIGGSATPVNTVQPTLIVTKIIYTAVYT